MISISFKKEILKSRHLREALQMQYMLKVYYLNSDKLMIAQLEKNDKIVYYAKHRSVFAAINLLEKKFENRNKSHEEYCSDGKLKQPSLSEIVIAKYLERGGQLKLSGGRFILCSSEGPNGLAAHITAAVQTALKDLFFKGKPVVYAKTG